MTIEIAMAGGDRNYRLLARFFIFCASLLGPSLLGASLVFGEESAVPMKILDALGKSGARQAIIVSTLGAPGKYEMVAMARNDTSATDARMWPPRHDGAVLADTAWVEVFRTEDVVIGRNGFAPSGRKREGDGRTPSGIFSLGLAFGYLSVIDSRLPYRQAGPDDVWVDDVRSENYNRWCRRDLANASSFEEMRRKDDLYKYGIVIGYNTNPIVPGNGSAIFFHIWIGPGSSTSGCVATREEYLLQLLKWLDPAKNPRIVLGMTGTI